MYLIDTNVLSEAWRGSKLARDWLKSAPRGLTYLSVITVGEIEKGIAVAHRRTGVRPKRLTDWLSEIREDFANRFLNVDEDVALVWGTLNAVRTYGAADGILGATAVVHGLTVVTRNTADFADMPVRLVNPWALAN